MEKSCRTCQHNTGSAGNCALGCNRTKHIADLSYKCVAYRKQGLTGPKEPNRYTIIRGHHNFDPVASYVSSLGDGNYVSGGVRDLFSVSTDTTCYE